mmetsp:Transcript_6080/g.17035  ORF Transcript_6080/g.17035 Transcript_6080/m.17035 type:complete len:190 (-) Transcript_6080:200-769(-)|eukprot:CAMPEP_0181042264 /NCGR_PEP_ID=MMETSP1070-20121207/12056_1 /TAXON_ID=265543 /ORGANISM="Minutocellus polymorphus, Strain NH13" /LENGTH=189 /DNA_ID=CAMNT_0023120463 /DNA_START=396 /DNA_END=965 /DNA_ORIENTATION=-
MKAPTIFLAVAALTAPHATLGQDCASIADCEVCAQSASCVWVQDTAQCLSTCPIWPGLTCTFGDASVCGNNGDDGGLSSGAIAGIVIGIILLLLIILAILLCCRKKPAPPIETKQTEDTVVMSNAELGSHNTHAIDVHRCQSANCVECGSKLDSPIKFVPADENEETMNDEEDAVQNEEMEDVEINGMC